jgi:ABC-type multidrug transport system permease subunit
MFDYDYTWSDFVGNIGVVILLVTYYLNVAGKIDSKGWQYNLANLIVAVLLSSMVYYSGIRTS